MTTPRRLLTAFVVIALVWFTASLLVLHMPNPPLAAMVPAILPVAALVLGVIHTLALAWGPGGFAPIFGYLAVTANALFWAAFLLALGGLVHRPTVRRVFLVVAIAWFPFVALPELLMDSTPYARPFYPLGPVIPRAWEWWHAPANRSVALAIYIAAAAASNLFWAAFIAGSVWLGGHMRVPVLRRLRSDPSNTPAAMAVYLAAILASGVFWAALIAATLWVLSHLVSR